MAAVAVAGTVVAVTGRTRARVATATAEAERLRAALRRRDETVVDLHRHDLQRSALLRSVTHDLRTPLAAIRAIAVDLRDGVPFDSATRTELVQVVCDEVDRLDLLVQNLLAMSRIDADAFTPRRQAVDLDELVHDRLRALAPLLRDHDLVVDVPDDLALVDADHGQIEQLVVNLVANAARHAPAGSALEVHGHDVEVDGRPHVRIEVVDHGPGVDPAVRADVFTAFVRGAGSRSTGLGLAICAEVVERHGGRMGLDDTPGGGATAWFALPALPPVDEAAAERAGGPS
ncbi:MAG: ATP-binding protein [Acidimicrobiales bacterium]